MNKHFQIIHVFQLFNTFPLHPYPLFQMITELTQMYTREYVTFLYLWEDCLV